MRLKSKNQKTTVLGVAGALVSFVWGSYSRLTTVAQLPDDASGISKMLADPPIYLPWLILIACVMALAWSLWPSSSSEEEVDSRETGSLVTHGTNSPAISAGRDVHIGGISAYNRFEGSGEFDLKMLGKSGVFANNIVTGFAGATVRDEGENNLIQQNAFGQSEVSPWDLPRLGDGSSDLWRVAHIVQMLLDEWQAKSGRAYNNKKSLMDDAKVFVNQELERHGEEWRVDDDLQRRLGYCDDI